MKNRSPRERPGSNALGDSDHPEGQMPKVTGLPGGVKREVSR